MLNSNVMLLITVCAVVAGVLGISIGLFPYLKKKGVPVAVALDTASDVVDKAGAVLQIANSLMPNSKIIDILELIQKWAKIAAGNAEQLYRSGELDKDKRKQAAQEVVYNVFKELNVELTDKQKILTDAAIENAVNALGHATVPGPKAAVQQ